MVTSVEGMEDGHMKGLNGCCHLRDESGRELPKWIELEEVTRVVEVGGCYQSGQSRMYSLKK